MDTRPSSSTILPKLGLEASSEGWALRWPATAILAVTVAVAAAGPRPAFLWAIASRIAYLGYVTVSLRWARATSDQGRRTQDFLRFRKVASLLIANDGFALLAVAIVTRGTLDIPWVVALVAATVLVPVGVACKVWAFATLGLSASLWRDFFEPPSACSARWHGPYRVLDNPMYTVGYVQVWAFPLLLLSGPGLVAGLFAHASILLFWWLVERPYARYLYRRTS